MKEKLRKTGRKAVRKGFTLVELLIVVVIIGILSALFFVGVKNFTSSAKSDTVLDAVNKMTKGAKMFLADTEYFPDAVSELWKNDDGSGNTIPNWNGPYLEPPGGDTTLTSYPLFGGTVTGQIVCTEGGAGTGKLEIEFTGDGLAPKLANEVVNKLGSGIATYDQTNNKLTILVTKAEAVSGQHIYCK